jgi:hypothetical protein
MSEDRLAEEMRKLARQFAPLVIDNPPSEIARILYLAHKRWDRTRKDYLQNEAWHDADVHEVFTDAEDALTAAILEELPPATRDHVMQLLCEMREKSRFDRLLHDVYLGGS